MGATGPNAWDCSSLVQAAFKQVGVDLPRVSQDQSMAGTPVSLANLQVGDILYWGGTGSAYHVGVYIGNGQYLDAANPSKGVVIQDLSGYPATARCACSEAARSRGRSALVQRAALPEGTAALGSRRARRAPRATPPRPGAGRVEPPRASSSVPGPCRVPARAQQASGARAGVAPRRDRQQPVARRPVRRHERHTGAVPARRGQRQSAVSLALAANATGGPSGRPSAHAFGATLLRPLMMRSIASPPVGSVRLASIFSVNFISSGWVQAALRGDLHDLRVADELHEGAAQRVVAAVGVLEDLRVALQGQFALGGGGAGVGLDDDVGGDLAGLHGVGDALAVERVHQAARVADQQQALGVVRLAVEGHREGGAADRARHVVRGVAPVLGHRGAPGLQDLAPVQLLEGGRRC